MIGYLKLDNMMKKKPDAVRESFLCNSSTFHPIPFQARQKPVIASNILYPTLQTADNSTYKQGKKIFYLKCSKMYHRVHPHCGGCMHLRNRPIFNGEKSASYIGVPDRFRIVLHVLICLMKNYFARNPQAQSFLCENNIKLISELIGISSGMHMYTKRTDFFEVKKSVLWTHFWCMHYYLGFVHRCMHRNAGEYGKNMDAQIW